jgi:hypothetical protein
MGKCSALVGDIVVLISSINAYKSIGGHLHDGGVNVDVFLNDKPICDSRASYSKDGGHGGKSPARVGILKRDGPHNDDGLAHITSMTTCAMMGRIKKGDEVQIKANYDFGKFQGMKSPEGKYTGVMGIAIMYAAADNPAAPAGNV